MFDCFDPVVCGVLRMGRNRQHDRADHSQPTIKSIAIAKFGTHGSPVAGPFYTNIGVYENEPIAATTNDGGFPGPDWGSTTPTAPTIPAQFGYRTTLQDDPYPRAFSVGGFYVTGSYADPLLNADGQNRVLFGGEPKMHYGSSEVYIQGEQMVYRPDASDHGLTVFGGTNWTTSGQPNVERMVFAGTYYKGAFAPRPNDTLGVAVSLST